MKPAAGGRIAAVLLLALGLFPADRTGPFADTAKLQIGFEGDPVSYTVAAFERGRVLYVSVEEFADALGFASYVNARNGKAVLRIGSRSKTCRDSAGILSRTGSTFSTSSISNAHDTARL